MEETAGHIRVIVLRILLTEFAVALEATLPALVQMRSYVYAGAVLQEGLTRLL